MSAPEKCACGLPLHYHNPEVQCMITKLVETLGPDVPVIWQGRTWRVPRHFIALHGLKAQELPELAKHYGFPEVTGN